MKTQQTAQNAYTQAAADISAMVSVLQVYADKLHDVSPDGVHWGHVGDLERAQSMLANVLATINQQEQTQ